ncbi:hypothetical protein [Sediminicoccus sp. KRV36]|uniref:hypothetical protein n=1 Tax=Sediminicoccus sp. KRV36 TaxID=3133721 RepID=UPI00200CB45C|nr:hypothetical protein [Sediminicoccus rosea]UPY39262.1 hypothetical protein LHU95_11380 [Sediminicoccus rosea]
MELSRRGIALATAALHVAAMNRAARAEGIAGQAPIRSATKVAKARTASQDGAKSKG